MPGHKNHITYNLAVTKFNSMGNQLTYAENSTFLKRKKISSILLLKIIYQGVYTSYNKEQRE